MDLGMLKMFLPADQIERMQENLLEFARRMIAADQRLQRVEAVQLQILEKLNIILQTPSDPAVSLRLVNGMQNGADHG